MKVTTEMPFEMKALEEICGQTIYAKGVALAKAGRVRNLFVQQDTVTAIVDGSDAYQVQVNTVPSLSCHCTCPAAEYQNVCKHSVAVILSASDVEPQGNNDQQTLQRYLSQLEHGELLEMVMEFLQRDPDAWDHWLMKAQMREEKKSYRELKSMVTKALPRTEIWHWRDVGDYFISAEHQITLIFEVMDSLDVSQQWKLVQEVVKRLNLVLERIDDSSGSRLGLEAAINRKMPEVFNRLDWSDAEKAQWLFKHLTEDEYDVFPSIEVHFADVCASNEHFLSLCRQALAQKPLQVDAWQLRQIATPLLNQAKDWREIAALKSKIASRTADFLELCELYLEHNVLQDAEDWLATARKNVTPYENLACDRVAVQVLVHQAEIQQAWQLANEIFEQLPSMAEYRALVQFQAQHQIEDAGFLSRVEQRFQSLQQRGDSPFSSNLQADKNALIEYYIDLQMLDEACDWVRQHQTSLEMLVAVADRVVDQHPEETLAFYIRAVTALIEQTHNEAYENAIVHLQKAEVMLRPHPETLEAFYLQVKELARTYKRKRNMAALFREHYAAYD